MIAVFHLWYLMSYNTYCCEQFFMLLLYTNFHEVSFWFMLSFFLTFSAASIYYFSFNICYPPIIWFSFNYSMFNYYLNNFSSKKYTKIRIFNFLNYFYRIVQYNFDAYFIGLNQYFQAIYDLYV